MQFIKLFSIKRCGVLVLLFSLAACQTATETIKQAEQTAETNEVQVPLTEKEKLLQAPNYYLQTSASDDAKAAFEKALTYKKEGKLALAKQHFTNLTLQYPNLSGAYLQLAYLAKQAEQSKQSSQKIKTTGLNPQGAQNQAWHPPGDRRHPPQKKRS